MTALATTLNELKQVDLRTRCQIGSSWLLVRRPQKGR
jgi:hypothetical protein